MVESIHPSHQNWVLRAGFESNFLKPIQSSGKLLSLLVSIKMHLSIRTINMGRIWRILLPIIEYLNSGPVKSCQYICCCIIQCLQLFLNSYCLGTSCLMFFECSLDLMSYLFCFYKFQILAFLWRGYDLCPSW